MTNEEPAGTGRASDGNAPSAPERETVPLLDFMGRRDLAKDPEAVTWIDDSTRGTPAAEPGQLWDFLGTREVGRQQATVPNDDSSDTAAAGDAPVPAPEQPLSIGASGRAVFWNGNGNGGPRSGKNRGRGLVNGSGLVNGNGLINGNSLVNGTGPANGTGIGLTGGSGLINGNGLVNGCRKPADEGSFLARPASGCRRAAAGKRLRLATAVAFAAGLVIGVPLVAMVAVPPDEGMAVDGDLSDWAGRTVLSDGIDGTVGSADQDIVRYATAASGNDVLFLVEVGGRMLAGKGDSVDFVNVFIDSDANSSTGYSLRGMGADNRIEAWGIDGQTRGCTFFGFSPAKGNADWNGWGALGSGKAAATQKTLELSARKSGFLDFRPGSYRALFQASRSHGGARDFSEMMAGPSGPAVLVSQVPVERPALAMAPGPQPILRLALEARGDAVRLSGVVLERSGNASAGTVGEVQLRSGERVVSSGRFAADRLDLRTDLRVLPGKTEMLEVLVNVLDGAVPGSVLGMGLAGQDSARLLRGTATVAGAGLRSFYIGAPPARITIDGAFGDWAGATAHPDPAGDGDGPCIDLVDGRAVKEPGALSFLARVDGTMLGGESVPLPFEDRPVPAPAGPPGPHGGVITKNLLVPQDTVAAYIDADASNRSGSVVAGTGIGAEYSLVVTGMAGRITGSQAFAWSAPNGSWELLGAFEAARDPDRLELRAPIRALGIALGPVFRALVLATDWSGGEDALDEPIALEDPLLMSDNSTIHSSSDGVSWKTEVVIDDTLVWRDLCTDSNGYAYALERDGTVFRSTGDWTAWSRIINSALHKAVALATDGTSFYALEMDGETFKAASGGSWSKQGDIGVPNDYEDMCIDSGGNLFAIRSSTCDTASNSSDGGVTWNNFGTKNVGNAGGTQTNAAVVAGAGWNSTKYIFILQSDGNVRYDTDGRTIDPWNATGAPGNSSGQEFLDIDYDRSTHELWTVALSGKVYKFQFNDTAPSGAWNTTLGSGSDANPIIAIAVSLVPEFEDIVLPLGGMVAIGVLIRFRSRKQLSG